VRCGHVGFLPLRLEERVRVVQVHSRVPGAGAGAGTRPLAGRQDPDLCCGGFHGKIGNRRPCAELDRCQPSPHQILNTGYSNDAPHQILMQGRAVRGGRQGRPPGESRSAPRRTPCHCSGRQAFGVGASGRPPQPCGTAVPGRCPTAPPDPSSATDAAAVSHRQAGTAPPKLTCTTIYIRARELQLGAHHHHHAPRPRSLKLPALFSLSSSPAPSSSTATKTCLIARETHGEVRRRRCRPHRAHAGAARHQCAQGEESEEERPPGFVICNVCNSSRSC
jgi:hypothetical protein